MPTWVAVLASTVAITTAFRAEKERTSQAGIQCKLAAGTQPLQIALKQAIAAGLALAATMIN